MGIEQDNCKITEIWYKYEPKIASICKYKLKSCPDEAEDVKSEVFAALVRECRIRKIPEKPEAWLLKVTHNLIKQKYAELKKHKEKEIYVDFSNNDLNERLELQVSYDFDDEAIDDDDIELLKKALLTELTEDEQLLIELVCEKRLKFKEIAVIMNLTEKAAKQKFYRTKLKVTSMSKVSVENFS